MYAPQTFVIQKEKALLCLFSFGITNFWGAYINGGFTVYMIWLFALLYLRSDSNTVPLADAKLSGQLMLLKKSCYIASFLSLLKRDDIIISFSCDLFVMHQGRPVSSNRANRAQRANRK